SFCRFHRRTPWRFAPLARARRPRQRGPGRGRRRATTVCASIGFLQKCGPKSPDIAAQPDLDPEPRVAQAAGRPPIDTAPVFEARTAVAGGFRRLLYAA